MSKEVLQKAVEVLRGGGVVMHPTETCYGLAVDIFNEEAVKKLYELKGRDFDKPVSVLVDSLGMAQEYGIFSDKALELAQRYWPGPVSIVVPRKKRLPEFLNPGEGFISMRWSSKSVCTGLVENFGGPITTTSANLSGEAPAYSVEQFVGADFVIDGGKLSENRPSTIVKVEGEKITMLRQGEVLVEEID